MEEKVEWTDAIHELFMEQMKRLKGQLFYEYTLHQLFHLQNNKRFTKHGQHPLDSVVVEA